MMIEWIGWLATAVFLASYFVREGATLRRVQGVAAGLWAAYGFFIGALPVFVANLIVAGVAVGSSFHRRAATPAKGED